MKTKKTLVILACGIIGFALPFLFFGFVQMNLNVTEWSINERAGVALFSLFVSWCGIMIGHCINNDL